MLADSLDAASGAERRRQRRLGRIVDDAAARDLVQRLTDEVLRIEALRVAAARFAGIVADHGVPGALGPIDRLLLAAGARLATRLPHLVMPLVRRRIVAETRGLVIPADDPGLAQHIAARRAAGVAQNINLLGEAILSDAEAASRLDRVLALIARPDVDYVSVKISALCAQLDVVAFEHGRRPDRRRPAPRVRRGRRSHAAGLRQPRHGGVRRPAPDGGGVPGVLDDPAFSATPAGIVLQAYLPDSHDVLERLGDWAPPPRRRRRGADQGAHRQGRQPGDGAGRRRAARVDAGAVPDQGRHRRQLQAPARLGAAAGVGRRGARRGRQPQPVRRRPGRCRCATACRRRCGPGGDRDARGDGAGAGPRRPGGRRRRCCCTARSSAPRSSTPASPTSPGASTRTPRRTTSCGRCSGCARTRRRGATRRRASAVRWPSGPTSTSHRAGRHRPPPSSPSSTPGGSPTNRTPTSRPPRRRAVVWAAVAAPPAATDFPYVDDVAGDRRARRVGRPTPPAAWARRPVDAARRTAARRSPRCWPPSGRRRSRVMADEAGKTVREADPEVSEAIDFARYAAASTLPPGARRRRAWWSSPPRGTSPTPSPPAACSPR